MVIMTILVALLLSTLRLGIVYQATTPWVAFWAILSLLLLAASSLVFIATKKTPAARRRSLFWGWVFDRGVFVVGETISNNNFRWMLAWATTVILFVSAIFAGFGEPILSSGWKEMKETKLGQEVANLKPETIKDEEEGAFCYLFRQVKILSGNTNPEEVLPPSERPSRKAATSSPAENEKAKSPESQKKKTWWHWGLFFISLAVAVLYTFPAFWDELMESISSVRRKREEATSSGAAETTGNEAAPAVRGWSFGWDLLTDVLGEWWGNIVTSLASTVFGGIVR